MTAGALDGIVVADFTRVLAGPYLTMLLGDLGADVIKVERPEGDDTRMWGPPFTDRGESAYFLAVNRNKRSVCLDLATEKGRVAARTLVSRADVVVENFRPMTMDRLGLAYEEVRRLNERIVFCSISGFGSGAGAALPGYDFVVQAVGGLMSITGEAGGAGTKVGVAVVDVLCGLHAAVAVLAALRERDRTGAGQKVEVNLLSSLLAGLVNQSSSYLTTGVAPAALGNAHPSIAPYESLRAADGMFVVAVGNDRQFLRMCEELGVPALAEDPRFARNPERVKYRKDLVHDLEKALAHRSVAEVVQSLTQAGVPAGRVNDVGEAFSLARSLGLAPAVTIDRDGGGVLQVANPIGLSRTPVTYRMAPPSLGEHTSEILTWLDPSHSGEDPSRDGTTTT